MPQIKALNLFLIKGAAEIEKQSYSAQIFRFIIIIIIIITRVVSSNKKNQTESSLGQNTEQNMGDPTGTMGSWRGRHLGTPPHLT